jgi:hypothetical protein
MPRVEFEFEVAPPSASSPAAALLPMVRAASTERTGPPAVRLRRQVPRMTDRDELVLLLHVAAEIEHALLVQYLYAAYSLDPAEPTQHEWRREIVEIAREEMSHLLSVQNVLRSLGAPLNFDRDEAPFRVFYPFELELAPLSVRTLARYVLAEMPDESELPPDIRAEIPTIRADAAVPAGVNRVSALFDLMIELTALVDETAFIRDSLEWQGDPQVWRTGDMILDLIPDRIAAASLLDAIGRQGEGPGQPPGGQPSHFTRFFRIYHGLKSAIQHGEPAANIKPLVVNPTVGIAGASIQDPVAVAWANLFDSRYRMLLADLAHMMMVRRATVEDTASEVLGQWARTEMYRLSAIADILTGLPAQAGPTLRAGPPFRLPYTLRLPDRQIDRWRHHLALIEQSTGRIAAVKRALGRQTDIMLDGMRDADRRAVDHVRRRIFSFGSNPF